MATNKLNDGVGKKIVEALKMHTTEGVETEESENASLNVQPEDSFETDNVDVNDASPVEETSNPSVNDNDFNNLHFSADVQNHEALNVPSDLQMKIQAQLQEQANNAQFQAAINNNFAGQSYIDNAFAQSLAQNIGSVSFNQVQDDFIYPTNVAVLKQLIAKLPTGVSRQTGAIIIKQTMEALGISMQNVIQEAKQVQETLNNNSREYQAAIVEYRKQIGILEAKSQQAQRQAAVMNDIISLFIHTGN